MGAKKSESQDLQTQAGHTIGETHMVVPSVLTLFGLQMMMSFNAEFRKELTQFEIWLDVMKLMLLALTAGLIVMPAAYHRQAEPSGLSEQFIEVVSWVIPLALGMLAAILGLDVYFMGLIALKNRTAGAIMGLLTAAGLSVCWFVLPLLLQRRLRRSETSEDDGRGRQEPSRRSDEPGPTLPRSPQMHG